MVLETFRNIDIWKNFLWFRLAVLTCLLPRSLGAQSPRSPARASESLQEVPKCLPEPAVPQAFALAKKPLPEAKITFPRLSSQGYESATLWVKYDPYRWEWSASIFEYGSSGWSTVMFDRHMATSSTSTTRSTFQPFNIATSSTFNHFRMWTFSNLIFWIFQNFDRAKITQCWHIVDIGAREPHKCWKNGMLRKWQVRQMMEWLDVEMLRCWNDEILKSYLFFNHKAKKHPQENLWKPGKNLD